MQQRRKTRKEKTQDGTSPSVNRKVNNWDEQYGLHSYKLTDAQKDLANKIQGHTLTFVDAPPGTGKSLAVLHTFVKEFLRDKHKQLIIIRTPVEAGMDKVGFLPDSLESKLAPHFSSSKYLLEQLLNKGKVETDMDHRIHFKIPNFVLGSTLDNSLVFIDEAQQLQPMIMKLLLERIGVNSTVVVAGDSRQLYTSEASKRNGLKDAIQRFFHSDGTPKFPDIAPLHSFTVDDVQRSEIVKIVIRAYEGM